MSKVCCDKEDSGAESKEQTPPLSEPVGGSCCAAPDYYQGGVEPPPAPGWTDGTLKTPSGDTVFRVKSNLDLTDRLGALKCRAGALRDDYRVEPGLYAIGSPGADSEVVVSANYKLSFDTLRKSLDGLDIWILVLDTKGINVWCAAGKGSFGTDELIGRIFRSSLLSVVDHRRLIVPQLGAPGVNAAEVKRSTGFGVRFGPVRAKDIKSYINAGLKATREQRTVSFGLTDRLVLAPMEVRMAASYFGYFAAAALVVSVFGAKGPSLSSLLSDGTVIILLAAAALASGAIVTPLLLPFIPGRSFALKGFIIGVIAALALDRVFGVVYNDSISFMVFSYVFVPAASSYAALQFTGASTFTSISGVRREMLVAVPLYVVAAAVSLVALALYKFFQWGLI